MKWPSTWMLFVIHICVQGSLNSAFASLFGHDPFRQGVVGLWVGFLTGLPCYVAAILRRSRR